MSALMLVLSKNLQIFCHAGLMSKIIVACSICLSLTWASTLNAAFKEEVQVQDSGRFLCNCDFFDKLFGRHRVPDRNQYDENEERVIGGLFDDDLGDVFDTRGTVEFIVRRTSSGEGILGDTTIRSTKGTEENVEIVSSTHNDTTRGTTEENVEIVSSTHNDTTRGTTEENVESEATTTSYEFKDSTIEFHGKEKANNSAEETTKSLKAHGNVEDINEIVSSTTEKNAEFTTIEFHGKEKANNSVEETTKSLKAHGKVDDIDEIISSSHDDSFTIGTLSSSITSITAQSSQFITQSFSTNPESHKISKVSESIPTVKPTTPKCTISEEDKKLGVISNDEELKLNSLEQKTEHPACEQVEELEKEGQTIRTRKKKNV